MLEEDRKTMDLTSKIRVLDQLVSGQQSVVRLDDGVGYLSNITVKPFQSAEQVTKVKQ